MPDTFGTGAEEVDGREDSEIATLDFAGSGKPGLPGILVVDSLVVDFLIPRPRLLVAENMEGVIPPKLYGCIMADCIQLMSCCW